MTEQTSISQDPVITRSSEYIRAASAVSYHPSAAAVGKQDIFRRLWLTDHSCDAALAIDAEAGAGVIDDR